MDQQLQNVLDKFDQLEKDVQDPAIISQQKKFAEVSQEYAEYKDVADAIRNNDSILKQIQEAKEMESDPSMFDIAKAEIESLNSQLQANEEIIKNFLRPSDPRDKKNVIIEIRAGAGGDEAGLFAVELYRMYQRYAESLGWKTNIIERNITGIGGAKEIIAEIKGKNVYSIMKYESGVHRVQRVPDTEKQGRVHTSTVTVAVMPEVDEVDVVVNPKDLRIDTYSSGGAGGQHVNKTESAVRITHIPTGLVAQSQDERSQQQNKLRAMGVLLARISQHQIEQQQLELAKDKKAQIGTGGRSEKIRTYNFPQDRITDHRIRANFSNIPAIMDGKMQDIIDQLKAAENTGFYDTSSEE